MVQVLAVGWDVLEDGEQLQEEGGVVEEQEVEQVVRDRCWSSRRSNTGLNGGNQGLELQQTNSGYQGGSEDSRMGPVGGYTGRREDCDVGGAVGLG